MPSSGNKWYTVELPGRWRKTSAATRLDRFDRSDSGSGGHVGATVISGDDSSGTQVRFLGASEAYRFPVASIANIPLVRGELLETHRRRYFDN